MSRRSTNRKASIQLDNDEFDEYKRNVGPFSSDRRLYSPHKDPIAYISKSTAEMQTKKSLTETDFVPRASGKLYDPYSDQMINSWPETSYGQMQRAIENSEVKSRDSKHLRTKSANGLLMTIGTAKDKEIASKETTRQDSNMRALKLLTKELVQLEKTVSDASSRFTKYINDDNSDSVINIHDESFWQKKITLHLSLVNKYFKYIHLNCSSSVKNDIESKCWKLGFYSLIEQFRSAVNLDRRRSKNRITSSFVISNQFSIFLDEAEIFYKRLLKHVADGTKSIDKSIEKNKPPKWIRCVCCLGDVTRYRWTYGLEDKERTKEYWAENASRWYRLGIHLNSNNGKFYHHLAILASQDELKALYYYCRSLMVNTPFMSTRESLVALFGLDNMRQKPKGNRGYLQRDNSKLKNYLDNQPVENLFVRLHGMLFTKIGLEHFDETFQSFLDKLLKTNTFQRTSNSNRHWMEFYLFLAVINLSGLYNYGNENFIIGKAQAAKNKDDIQSLDADPIFAQESRLTFIIMNHFMLKYLESEAYQPGHEVSEGWLLYCEIIMLWMVASGIFDGFANGSNNSTWEKIMRKSDFPGSWEVFARFLTNITHQIPSTTKEKILDSVNNDIEQESIVQIQPPALAEDWELRGISLLQSIYEQHNLFERASKPNINFADSEVEDIINVFYNDEHNFILDQDEKTRRRARIMELGYILTKKITGLDFDVKRDSFTVSSDLNANAESDEIKEIEQQTAELSIEEDDDDAILSTEPSFGEVDGEYSEDNNEGIMELKSRRQELEALLAASRNNMHSSKSKSSAKKLKKVKRTVSGKNFLNRIVPGYTSIIVDTNCLIGDLEIVKKVIQSEKWVVIVPSIVVTELDGLKYNPPPLGHAAHEALEYLNETLSTKKIRIQTSKGNYLTDISFSEEFDFGNGEDKKKNLDDLILGICLWHSKHNEKNGLHDKSNENNEVTVLLTNDRNLRVKARARGVNVVGVKDFTGIV
ncbi:unnamed protein product [Rhizophagus irregularis]|uniref:PIN domain-containing protein n=1 Tax=Rhizophagus irregularis TaxID=588596 RepID=A0A2I1GE59_9GLOM|nr:hypothetical protein RhiirA4_443407 [Rhizophagus irregularis]CAB4406875.1 unnamed protein product [Rhizophagus irregularis]